MPDDDDFVVPVDYVRDPGRTGPDIHAALHPENREAFEAEWAEAIDHAARTFDLEPAHKVLERWWPIAAVNNTPEHEADMERAKRRVDDGAETFVHLRFPDGEDPRPATGDRVLDWPLPDSEGGS